MRLAAPSVAALSLAVVPTARAVRWTPPVLLGALLVVVGVLTGSAARPAGPILVVSAAALAAAVVGTLHDPAWSLLEALPVSAMRRRVVRLCLVGLPGLALWTWLATTAPGATGPGVGPVVALIAAGTAAVVWTPRRRAPLAGVGLPVGWYVLGGVVPGSGPLATLADAWWDHSWPVAAAAVGLCVLGRSR